MVQNGNTIFYLELAQQKGTYFYISASDDPTVVLLNVGDRVTVTHGDPTLAANNVVRAYSVTRIG